MNFTLHFTSFLELLEILMHASMRLLMSGSVFQEQTTECVAYKWMSRVDGFGGTCYKAMGDKI